MQASKKDNFYDKRQKYTDIETLAKIKSAAIKLDKNDSEATIYSAMAKRFATDVGFTVCNEALQIFGGYGYIQEYPLERYVRDVRVHQILEGTNEIMKMIIGRRMIMEDAASIIQ